MHVECQTGIHGFAHDPGKTLEFLLTECQSAEPILVRLSGAPWISEAMLAPMEARIPEAYLHRRGYYQVRPSDIISRTDLLLLDVRFAPEDLDGELGHIHKSQYLPLAELDRFTHPLDTALVVVCGNGRESVRAAERLAARGFSEVYHLVGGLLRWNAEERPVARAGSWSHYTP